MTCRSQGLFNPGKIGRPSKQHRSLFLYKPGYPTITHTRSTGRNIYALTPWGTASPNGRDVQQQRRLPHFRRRVMCPSYASLAMSIT